MFSRVLSISIALMVASFAAGQGRGDAARGARGGGLANKVPDLPAGAFTASSTVAHTTLQHEWVDIPFGAASLEASPYRARATLASPPRRGGEPPREAPAAGGRFGDFRCKAH